MATRLIGSGTILDAGPSSGYIDLIVNVGHKYGLLTQGTLGTHTGRINVGNTTLRSPLAVVNPATGAVVTIALGAPPQFLVFDCVADGLSIDVSGGTGAGLVWRLYRMDRL